MPFRESFGHGTEHYIVMDYMPDGNLTDRIQREGALPLQTALDIALDIADALIRAHRLGIIHRDIKPDNILFDAEGKPRLGDFGVAGVGDGKTQLTGTPYYMSPEAWQGQPQDAQADIWSFGVVLYEMLAKDSAQRYSSIREVSADLERGVPSEPLAPPSSSRGRWVMGAAVGLLIIAVIGGFLLLSGGGGDDDAASSDDTADEVSNAETEDDQANPTPSNTPSAREVAQATVDAVASETAVIALATDNQAAVEREQTLIFEEATQTLVAQGATQTAFVQQATEIGIANQTTIAEAFTDTPAPPPIATEEAAAPVETEEVAATRLPTEAEWEYAGRGPDNWLYPWGDDFAAENAIWNREAGLASLPPNSGLRDTSWVGAVDMMGNVCEWTSSVYATYPYVATYGREIPTGELPRVRRGGSWRLTAIEDFDLRSRTGASRFDDNSPAYAHNGFRCAADF